MKNPNQINSSANQDSELTLRQQARAIIEKNVRSEEYCNLMNPIVEKLDDETVASINEAFLFGEDHMGGYKKLIHCLSDVLNIKTPRIRGFIISEAKFQKGHEDGHYKYRENAINIYQTERTYDSISKEGNIVQPVRVLAHEMWHAYQEDQIKNNGPRAEFYRGQRSKCYIDSDGSDGQFLEYLKQPIEAEAFTFSEKFTNRFFDKLEDQLFYETLKYDGQKRTKALGKATLFGALFGDKKNAEKDPYDLEMETKSRQLEILRKTNKEQFK